MQRLHILVSLIFSGALLTCAETTLDTNLDWGNVAGSADLETFDNHGADNLFSDTDPDGLAWDPKINLEGSSPSFDFLADAGVNNNNDIAGGGGGGGGCLSSSFQNFLSTDGLQARSSPTQCPNPLDNSNPGSTTTTPPATNLDPKILPLFEGGFPGSGIEPDENMCPSQRFGLRQLALCDSGSHNDIDQDRALWTISLRNPTPCTYD